MSAGSTANLSDRAIIRVGGPDAAAFLQGLITNDVGLLERQPAIFAGLLSPQGKVLFEFLAAKDGEAFRLAVARPAAADLIKRLSMYKLRARVEIALQTDPVPLSIAPDPRLPGLDTAVADYDAHRIALGVPEGGKDYAFGNVFPHEAMFDQLHGVSFTKGCYVGQEIVSRMQHRGTARSRFLIVDAEAPLPALGTPVLAGDTPLGEMGSSVRNQGLALIRLDRLADTYAAGKPITTGGILLRLGKPGYATFEVPAP